MSFCHSASPSCLCWLCLCFVCLWSGGGGHGFGHAYVMLGLVTVQAGQNETDHRPVTHTVVLQHNKCAKVQIPWRCVWRGFTSCVYKPSVPPDWISLTRRGKYEAEGFQSADLHTLMKPATIGQNWFFSFLIWLSHNWVRTSSRGELIDLELNSSLFSLENNYAVTGRAEERGWPLPPGPAPLPLLPLFVMRGIISAAIHNRSQTIHCVLLSEEVELDEKCPPARYMKVWNCRLLFALGRVPQKVFLLLLTEWLNVCWLLLLLLPPAPHVLLEPWLLLFPGHFLSIPAIFSISQGLLYEDKRHRHHRPSGKCT